jgi:hypothetical protein
LRLASRAAFRANDTPFLNRPTGRELTEDRTLTLG